MSAARQETELTAAMRARARAIRAAGGIDAALAKGTIPKLVDTTLSEGLVLGLLKQGVRKYLAIFGHGSTDLGEVLRIYEEEGVTRTFNCRNEVAMAHAATALRWQYGEIPAVVTSIGPGALQALAGSLAAASNGVGVYHIYGDETTFGEGYQHAAGAEGGAGPVRPDDGDHGPLLRAAHAARRCATRCAAVRSPSTIPIARGRSTCCCRSTPSPRASPSTSPRCPSAPDCRRSRPPPTRRSRRRPS